MKRLDGSKGKYFRDDIQIHGKEMTNCSKVKSPTKLQIQKLINNHVIFSFLSYRKFTSQFLLQTPIKIYTYILLLEKVLEHVQSIYYVILHLSKISHHHFELLLLNYQVSIILEYTGSS